MRAVLRWLTRDRFSWTEVILIGTTVATVAHYSLSWWAGIGICFGVGLVVSPITILLRRAAGTRDGAR